MLTVLQATAIYYSDRAQRKPLSTAAKTSVNFVISSYPELYQLPILSVPFKSLHSSTVLRETLRDTNHEEITPNHLEGSRPVRLLVLAIRLLTHSPDLISRRPKLARIRLANGRASSRGKAIPRGDIRTHGGRRGRRNTS